MAKTVLRESVKSAALSVASGVILRLVSFVANAYMLRRVSADFLGVNVRLWLLFDTVLFLSREAFRNACLSRPEQRESWRSKNPFWLSR